MPLAPHDTHRTGGFTILELMISVAILGLLAAVAIPNFLSYQATSRRSEAFSNVASIANMETTYFSERDAFFNTDNWYPAPPSGVLGLNRMTWDASAQSSFQALGWAPEGQVFYGYEVNTPANPGCACSVCFTASAYGDVDGDGFVSAIMHAKPDPGGFMCGSIDGTFGPPTRPEEVMINGGGDAH